MRSVFYKQYGEPRDVLRIRPMSDMPTPRTGQVLIRVRSRPIHPGDLISVRGRYVGLNETSGVISQGATPGFEGVGIVEAVGPNVASSTGPTLGDRVAFFPVESAWSDYVLAPVQFVTPVPKDIPDGVAGQLHVKPIAASLLMRALEQSGLKTGDLVVFSAAGSAVAKLAMTVALRKGLSVVGIVRTAEGAASLQPSFLEAAIVATESPDWRGRLHSATRGRPIRAVLDPVGGGFASDLVTLLAEGGTFISYGDLSGSPISIPPHAFSMRGLTMKGISLRSWAGLYEGVRAEDIGTAIELARSDPDLFSVAAEYDLTQIREAVIHVEQPGRNGSVLLTSI